MHIITKIRIIFLLVSVKHESYATTTAFTSSFGISYRPTNKVSLAELHEGSRGSFGSSSSLAGKRNYCHDPGRITRSHNSSPVSLPSLFSKLQSTTKLEPQKKPFVKPYNSPKRSRSTTKLYSAKVSGDDETMPLSLFQIFNAAMLIAGTTIGGGFLALPTIVSRSGFIPSAVSIICVWFYFLAQSFAVVECIQRTKQENDQSPDEPSAPGVAAVVKSIYGIRGEVVVGMLLTILVEATLVSQISRAGMLFSNYRLGCLLSAFSVAALVFGPKSGAVFASKANAVLTSLFLLSTLTVFGIGSGIADWSQLGGSSMSRNWSLVPSILPTFLQLMCYGEILSTVCQILQYNTRYIHTAIVMGSFLTMCLQIGWSALGTSLVPVTPTGVAATALGDPVAVLLSGSGPVRLPLFCLAITAILTTILGSYLALLSTYNDFVNAPQNERMGAKHKRREEEVHEHGMRSFVHRFKAALVISIPSSLIACTSPSVFLKAIDFAGSYPVLILWGVLPPLMALRSRSKMDQRTSSKERNTAGSLVWLLLLEFVSLFMVGTNVFQDVSHVWNNLSKL